MATEIVDSHRLRTDEFDFELPREAIAARPAVPRDAARLLVVDGGFVDSRISDFPELLRPTDIVVLNAPDWKAWRGEDRSYAAQAGLRRFVVGFRQTRETVAHR